MTFPECDFSGCDDLIAIQVETSISQDEYTCPACPEGSDDLSGMGLSCTGKDCFKQYIRNSWCEDRLIICINDFLLNCLWFYFCENQVILLLVEIVIDGMLVSIS